MTADDNKRTDQIPRLALRASEAARALGVSERKLWQIVANDESGIPIVRLGKTVLFPIAPLEAWLANRSERRETKSQSTL